MIIEQFNWFFKHFSKEFTRGKQAFEIVMFLSLSHCFGFYNPKQLADYLNVPHQRLYEHLKDNFTMYLLKKMLVQFMVSIAVEYLKRFTAK